MSSAVHPQSLRDLASRCGAVHTGDGSTLVSGIASIASARPGDLVFAENQVKLDEALRSQATAVIVGEFAAAAPLSKPTLIARDPKLAFARVAALFTKIENCEGCHIGNGTSIGANSVIGARVIIGQKCRIGPNVTIYSRTELGDRVVVQAGTVLGSTGFGYVRDESGRYQLFPQIGRLVIEDDVEIGAHCTIDRGALDATVIHRGAKIDNMVHVGHNVEIGEDVVIAAQTGISGSSRIGNGAVVGGQVGLGDHVEIEAGVILGSGSGVLSNKVVRGKGIVYWGTPARPLKQYLKELATLARLTQKKAK
jgi:UDP-3-O-[3-hydroxymyristoyl] glucosamine N-acyltransferase